MRVLISGGGTGGHIFPAVSIANALRELDPTCEILFVGALGRMEMERVPQAGYPIVGLPIKGFDRMVEELTQAYADIGFKRGRSVIIKMLKYLINEQKLIVKRDNHYYFGYTPAEIDLFHEEE